MTRGRINAAVEPPLFVIETSVTRDEPFGEDGGGWGSRPKVPLGDGWRIVDFLSSEKRTRWERRRLVPSRGRP
jgi:hypothetical protein